MPIRHTAGDIVAIKNNTEAVVELYRNLKLFSICLWKWCEADANKKKIKVYVTFLLETLHKNQR